MRQPRWAIFISGRGSNMSALLEMRDAIEIGLVVSSKASAAGLAKARRNAVPTLVLDKKIDWQALHKILIEKKIERIFLAGFMRVVPADFVSKWQGKILNLHPSLLPLYPGLESIERAHADDAEMGATVHVVTEGVDEGPILAKRKTLEQPRSKGVSLEAAEFYVHVDEQRLVKETVLKWQTR